MHGTAAGKVTFTSTGASLLIDFCGGGRENVPVNFLITLNVRKGSMMPDPPTRRFISEPSQSVGIPMMTQQERLPTMSVAPTYSLTSTSGPVCGTTTYPPDRTKIVNGEIAHSGFFPWMVALVHRKYKQVCVCFFLIPAKNGSVARMPNIVVTLADAYRL